jgi:hypothetical protein
LEQIDNIAKLLNELDKNDLRYFCLFHGLFDKDILNQGERIKVFKKCKIFMT